MNGKLKKFVENSTSFKESYKLSNINWFKVGGGADLLFKPKSETELQEFLAQDFDIDILVLGVGSNIIVREGGYRGCVIKLGKAFTDVKQISDTEIEVGAANLDQNIALHAANLHISGLEFLSGIPGTIGGAIKMNAGAYGYEFKDIVKKIYGYDKKGVLHEISREEMNYSYRKSAPNKDLIYVRAVLKGKVGEVAEIKKNIKQIQENRENSQPIRAKTGGSTFQNPKGQKAWKLIEQAGCRGLAIGNAVMSEKHCNFMINTGNASAKELEDLGNLVQQKVLEATGIKLKWEIKIIGEK